MNFIACNLRSATHRDQGVGRSRAARVGHPWRRGRHDRSAAQVRSGCGVALEHRGPDTPLGQLAEERAGFDQLGQAGGAGPPSRPRPPTAPRRRRPRRRRPRAGPWRRARRRRGAVAGRPRTSTRTAPGPPSGWGGRSIGSRAVSRSRRVAATRGGDPLRPRERRDEQQGVGQRGPVAVLRADRVGEPAQLAARARAGAGPSRRRASRAPAARAPGGAGGRTPARRCPRWATWISSTASKRAAAWARARRSGRGEAGADHDGTPRSRASASRSSRPARRRCRRTPTRRLARPRNARAWRRGRRAGPARTTTSASTGSA